MLTCCENEVRRELDTRILQLYHDELSRLMREEGGGRRVEFTVDDLRPAYEIAVVFQARIFSMMVSMFANVS